jgi:protein-S-isoprenylcysteine O-methyltransferase Ste14
MQSDDTAGIALPAPVHYAACFLVGVGLDELWPVDLLPGDMQHPLGGALMLASAVIAVAAAYSLRRARTPIDPRRPATVLVTGGIFALSRNPLYLALTLLHVGSAVKIDNVRALLLVAPAVAFVDRSIIGREERYLERRFGAAYLAYKARVRRWI